MGAGILHRNGAFFLSGLAPSAIAELSSALASESNLRELGRILKSLLSQLNPDPDGDDTEKAYYLGTDIAEALRGLRGPVDLAWVWRDLPFEAGLAFRAGLREEGLGAFLDFVETLPQPRPEFVSIQFGRNAEDDVVTYPSGRDPRHATSAA